MPTIVVTGISELLTLKGVAKKRGRKVEESDLGVIKDAALIVDQGQIQWVGPRRRLKLVKGRKVDLGGRTVLPGFVECHTHTVFAGDRSDEFEQRVQGLTYQQIAEQGGGILSTVKATRKASAEELRSLTQDRVNVFVKQGVTTLEIKSGYGLDLKNEVKCLSLLSKLKGPSIVGTFLGAHALPPEFSSAQDYVEYLIKTVLPKIAGIERVERVDAFVEKGYFSPDQIKRLFGSARVLGLKPVVHADQLTLSGGTELALAAQALSADHLVQINKSLISELGNSSTVAVLLPAADFYLHLSYPPARTLLDAGTRVALATDFNPGSSPTQDLSFVGVLARLHMNMRLHEVITAYTYSAAAALGRERELGALLPGRRADFVVIDGGWRELFYQVGHHPVTQVWRDGRKIWSNKS